MASHIWIRGNSLCHHLESKSPETQDFLYPYAGDLLLPGARERVRSAVKGKLKIRREKLDPAKEDLCILALPEDVTDSSPA